MPKIQVFISDEDLSQIIQMGNQTSAAMSKVAAAAISYALEQGWEYGKPEPIPVSSAPDQVVVIAPAQSAGLTPEEVQKMINKEVSTFFAFIMDQESPSEIERTIAKMFTRYVRYKNAPPKVEPPAPTPEPTEFDQIFG